MRKRILQKKVDLAAEPPVLPRAAALRRRQTALRNLRTARGRRTARKETSPDATAADPRPSGGHFIAVFRREEKSGSRGTFACFPFFSSSTFIFSTVRCHGQRQEKANPCTGCRQARSTPPAIPPPAPGDTLTDVVFPTNAQDATVPCSDYSPRISD